MKTNVTIENIEYYVNEEKGVIVCVLTAYGLNQRHKFRGKARCSLSDTFDEVKGRRIAESRAKAALYKSLSQVYAKMSDGYYYLMNKYGQKSHFCNILLKREIEHLNKLCE